LLKKIFHIFYLIAPFGNWRIPVILLSGIFSGFGAYVFYISNAPSYLSDSPTTCVNCHIMAPQYTTWMHSSHREVTTCNDCHVPHDNIFHTYLFKAQDGIRHATIFTLRKEPQVILIREAGIEVVQDNCERCHTEIIGEMELNGKNIKTCRYCPQSGEEEKEGEERLCWDCHREVPHGTVNSLSSTPNAKVPLPESPVPDWLKKAMEKNKK